MTSFVLRPFLMVSVAIGSQAALPVWLAAQPSTLLPAGVSPSLATPTPVAAPAVKVLLLPFDELPAAAPALVPAPAPAAPILPTDPAPVVPAPVVPAPIVPEANTAPITIPAPAPAPAIELLPEAPTAPGAVGEANANARVEWRALAQAREETKEERRARTQRREAEKFRLGPESPSVVEPFGQTAAPAIAPTTPNSLVNDFANVAQPLTPPPAPREAGAAQSAAATLRGALGSRGWSEVLNAAPDSPTVLRVLGENRLSTRVLNELRGALSLLAATPNDDIALRAGVRAASRVGQSLGYRAVVPLHVGATQNVQSPDQNVRVRVPFVLLLADAEREQGRVIAFDETGANEEEARAAGSATAAVLIDRAIREWAPVSAAEKREMATRHIEAARVALAAGESLLAQDELNQAVALEPNRSEAFVLLGDALASTNAEASARAFRRAVELDARDGATWAKIAQSYANATPPDPVKALEAGRKALATGFDAVDLRLSLATAEFARADSFRRSERIERAEDAELAAREHLERVLQLAPDDPAANRLLARSLLQEERLKDAVSVLDRVAPRFPEDVEIQALYANALARTPGRQEDAFIAASRVWKMTSQTRVEADTLSYRTLAGGFDVRVYNIGRASMQLMSAFSASSLPREAVFLQLSKFREEMTLAEEGIQILAAPPGVSKQAAEARVFAATLTSQAIEALQTYLETGEETYRTRGLDLYRQSVSMLNVARTAN